MRLLTLNTWKCDGDYQQRLATMAQGLAELAPDVVLLQEVFATGDGQADTAAYLADALSMTALCAPARRKSRRFDGRLTDSTSGLAILTRATVVEHHVQPLPSDAADGERIAQLAHLDLGQRDCWLVNLHLTHLPQASTLRSQQLQTTLYALQTLASHAWAVIGGDFNAGPGHPEFDALLAPPWNLVNPCAGQHKTTHRTDAGCDLDLDHLLLRGWPITAVRRACIALESVNSGISDHSAVLLELHLSGSSP